MNAVGVISCKKLLIEDLTPAAGSLTTQAIASVQAFFAEANHHPSPDMVLALTEAARVMEAMANGDCDPAIYLSSLDPGVGKTRTIIHFIQSLLASSDHQDVGVLVCVSRLQEIGSLVGAMGLVRDQFGVLTSDAGLNRLGVSPTSARVLFTTHAMVERRTEGRRFSEVKELSWKANTLVDGIASTINTKPDEQWLVVHHQTGINMDLPDQVRSLLVGDSDRVHFLGWGSHDATNEFANVSNVILAGTLFYRTSRCEALGRLVSDRPSADGEYSEDDRREIELGEHCHLILQALCRGSVRRCVGNVCAPCDAYIIASVRSGIPSMIKNIFPGCRVMPWRPVARAVGGKVAEALRFITEQLASDPGRLLRFVDVAKAIGMDRSNFRRSVRQHSDFIEALAAEGVVEEGNGFRLVAREAMDEAA